MTGERKETAWRVFGLAGEPQHKREHRRRQRVQRRAAADMIVSGFAPHLSPPISHVLRSSLESSGSPVKGHALFPISGCCAIGATDRLYRVRRL